jgi:hypothetical protein
MNTVWLVVLVVICVGVGLWLASLIVEALRRPPEAIRDRQFCLASGCGRILPPSLARRTSIETPLRIDSNWIVDGIEAAGCMPKIVNSVRQSELPPGVLASQAAVLAISPAGESRH